MLCTGRTAHRESRGIALPFLDHGEKGVRGQRHAPAALYSRERPGTHCTEGWVGPRSGLDRCGKSRPTGVRSPDRPARSQSLYRLRYPAHILHVCVSKIRLKQNYLYIFFFICNHIPTKISRNTRGTRAHLCSRAVLQAG
jgi:hypothetical protein